MAHGSGLPRLGIAFVAMKRNIADLPEVIRLGQRLGADRYSVSNVLAHTPGDAGAGALRPVDRRGGGRAVRVGPGGLAAPDGRRRADRRAAGPDDGRPQTGARSRAGRGAGEPTRAPSSRRAASRSAGTGRSAPACRSSTPTAATWTSGPGPATPSPSANVNDGASRRPGATPPTSRCASGSWPSTSPPARSATAATWPTRTSRTASAAPPRPAGAVSGRRASSAARSDSSPPGPTSHDQRPCVVLHHNVTLAAVVNAYSLGRRHA